MKEQIIIFMDVDYNEALAVTVVDENIKMDEIVKIVKREKDKGEWQASDIIEAIPTAKAKVFNTIYI